MKFEKPGSNDQSILSESLLLKNIKDKDLKRMPKYFAHGTIGGNRYLAMSYFEFSIEEYI